MSQREGRIQRQGNENPEIQIFRYITEGSFDSYSYQLIETKQRFISQVMENNSNGEREMEDIDEAVMSYAEIKAIATGNPLILEKFKVDTELNRLQMRKSKFDANISDMTRAVTTRLPAELNRHKLTLENLKADISKRIDTSGDKFIMTVMDTVYNERAKAGERILAAIKEVPFDNDMKIGALAGLDVYIRRNSMFNVNIYLRGQGKYPADISDSAVGTVTRLENVLKSFDQRITDTQNSVEYIKRQSTEMTAELGKPFPHMAELESLRKRKVEIDTALDLAKEKMPVVTTDKPKTLGMSL